MADNFNLRSFLIENKLTKNTQNISEAQFSDSYDTPAAKKVHGQLRDIVDIFQKSRNEEEQEVEAAIQAAEQETGSQVTPTEKSVLLQQARWIRMHDTEMEREGTENKKPIMKETKLTAKERRLVEMVNNAMGYQEEENVDYTMGRQDDPNQLPNPAPELNIPEGEEMVQEKPMPKYESIDQLMKEIEHGTNEAAHKYKMEEMKRIYELLETKVTSLEEGENAEHIDQSKVKQMRKDIAALRKAEEKLRKEFEKKFTGKEKKEAPKKAEKEAATEAASEALQEGTFDLRKFLIENKLTKDSRILKEEIGTPINYEKLKQILLLACNTYPEDDEDGSALYEKEDVKHTLKYIMTLEKGVKNDDFDVFDKLEGQEPATLEGIVNLDDVQSTKWDDFDLALSVVSSVAYEYDLDDAASALGDLANAVDSFQL